MTTHAKARPNLRGDWSVMLGENRSDQSSQIFGDYVTYACFRECSLKLAIQGKFILSFSCSTDLGMGGGGVGEFA